MAGKTVAVILGASDFPKFPGFRRSDAFRNSARGIQSYFASNQGANIAHADILNLFDSEKQWVDQDDDLRAFFSSHADATDVFVYYVGHGYFAGPNEYLLACKRSEGARRELTGISVRTLAATLTEHFRKKRIFVILDCCFAGAAVPAFQAPPVEVAQQISTESLPRAGTALLLASPKNLPAITGTTATTFSSALLDILNTGVDGVGQLISFANVRDEIYDRFQKNPSTDKSAPMVLAPSQPFGDLCKLGIFPNHKWRPDAETAAESSASRSSLPAKLTWLGLALAILGLSGIIALVAWRSGKSSRLRPMTSWVTRSGDNSRTGWNSHESTLSQASVASKGLVRASSIPIPGDARGMEAQPLVVPSVKLPDGSSHDVMILASMSNVVRAVDARSGIDIWRRVPSLGKPIDGSKLIDYHEINDNWGILSTGVIDPETRRLYLVAWISPDHSPERASHYVLVLNVADGSQVVPPVRVNVRNGNQSYAEVLRKQRSSLLLTSVGSHKTVFFAASSVFEVGGSATGWIIAFDCASNAITAALATSQGSGAGIWMAGQGLVADDRGFLYGSTGNGGFDGKTNWGESFVKLQYTPPFEGGGASLKIVDHWTPWTDASRSPSSGKSGLPEPGKMVTGMWADQDFGSAGPACIFDIGVCIAAGKDGIGYPIKTGQMGATTLSDLLDPKANCRNLAASPVWLTFDRGVTDPCPSNPATLNFSPHGNTRGLFMTPVQYFDPLLRSWTIFVWGSNAPLRKWAISSTGSLKHIADSGEYASAEVQGRPPGGMPGGFCSGSSNAADPNSAVVACTVPLRDANAQVVGGRLLVYDAVHVATNNSLRVLWDSQKAGVRFQFNKFIPPVINGGQIYVPTYEGVVDVYRLAD